MNLHVVCFNCGRYGHNKDGCLEKFSDDEAYKAAQSTRQKGDNAMGGKPPQVHKQNQKESSIYGEWMVAKKDSSSDGEAMVNLTGGAWQAEIRLEKISNQRISCTRSEQIPTKFL